MGERKTTVIWVHGLGTPAAGYSHSWRDYLLRGTEDDSRVAAIDFKELFYNRLPGREAIINLLRIGTLIAQVGPQGMTLKDAENIVRKSVPPVVNPWLESGVLEGIFERLAFLLQESTDESSAQGVEPRDHDFHLVCHSFGNLIGYEFLHWCKGRAGIGAADLRFQNVFMIASPLSLLQSMPPGSLLNRDSLAMSQPLSRPEADGRTNIRSCWAYCHAWDPVAGTVVMDSPALLDRPPYLFEAFHTGAMMHDCENYLAEFGPDILAKILLPG